MRSDDDIEGHTILVADDHEQFRRMLQTILESELPQKVCVVSASDGHQALEQFFLKKPALVFLDINMPGPNGLHVTKHIKTAAPGTGVVIFTNHDTWEYRQASKDSGADQFFSKQTSTMDEVIGWAAEFLSGKK